MAHASAEDLRSALSGIDAPTLLVYGNDDIRAPAAVAEQLHEAIRNSTLVRLADAGHVCNIEAAAEFNGLVRAFVRDHLNPAAG